MKKIETIELFNDNDDDCNFNYEIKNMIEELRYELLEKKPRYARLQKKWGYQLEIHGGEIIQEDEYKHCHNCSDHGGRSDEGRCPDCHKKSEWQPRTD